MCLCWQEKTDGVYVEDWMVSIFITAAIDAKDKIVVAIIDLPGAFLHSENDGLADGSCCISNIQEIYIHNNMRREHSIYESPKSAIWNVKKCTFVLQKTQRWPKIMVFR